ncbi:MAG TPA: DNA helicase RecQ [Spirochaetota bacterium]|nr:DNA helicase RecQ [Spirochaetota bacterium]
MHKANQLLKEIFGYSSFRPVQQQAIKSVLDKHDTIAIMPTGGGKSLCYQIPALIFNGLTLVVSPLISLMKDQLDQLLELGIEAGMLNSTLSDDEYAQTVSRIKEGKIKILYCAPETLLQQRTINLLDSTKLSLIAVDEAHCISEWGHDFRPEYRRIAEVRSRFNDAVCIALTATATDQVRLDIASQLKIKPDSVMVASFDRPNLFIDVIPKTDPQKQAIDFIQQFSGQPGIIYCFSRRQVDELSEYLNNNGINNRPYHAGLTDNERQTNQNLFRNDDINIITATVAFGMGINKPDIRFVLHYDMPQNIESYYQQIGRAGRDGLPAHCRLLFGYGDINKIQFFINQKNDSEKKTAYNKLNDLLSFLEKRECRRVPLMTYFSEKPSSQKCDNCDNCLTPPPDEKEYTIQAQKFLSCIIRLDQRYGASLIIDVLRGSKSEKVKKSGALNISTYGIGSELSKSEWMNLFRQMSSKGLLKVNTETGSLIVTKVGADILKGKQKFYGYITPAASPKASVKKSYLQNSELFEQLRTLRKQIADADGVPPYTVFPDKTLIEMTQFLPQDPDDLLMIYGVGHNKLQKFGNQFLDIIKKFCINNPSNNHQRITANNKNRKESAHSISSKMYQAGTPVHEIAQRLSIQTSTVIDHLYKWISEDNPLDCEALLDEFNISEELCFRVHSLFEKHGVFKLKPVFEEAAGEIDYEILKILRLWYITGKNS